LGGCCTIITPRSPPRYPRKQLINRLNRSTILDFEINQELLGSDKQGFAVPPQPNDSAFLNGRIGLPQVRERAQPPILNDYRELVGAFYGGREGTIQLSYDL
jgi:hypothetical protein